MLQMQADFLNDFFLITSTSMQLNAARGPHWHRVSLLKAQGSVQANTRNDNTLGLQLPKQ